MKSLLLIISLALSVAGQSQTLSMTGKAPSARAPGYDYHVVVQGETLYSLAKRYHTTVNELLQLNPDISNNNLVTGKKIKVPLLDEQTIKQQDEEQNKKMENAVLHEVKKGETMYSISKQFNTDVETIKLWNDMNASDIKIGQKLIVGYETPEIPVVGPLDYSDWLVDNNKEEKKESKKDEKKDITNKTENTKTVPVPSTTTTLSSTVSTPTTSSTNSTTSNTPVYSAPSGVKMISLTEKGIATWSKTSGDDGSLYALHPTAPKGTMITVTNIMNHKSVNVKVIGKLPATMDNQNVVIKLSNGAAKQLNVLDDKVIVQLSYTGPEPQQ